MIGAIFVHVMKRSSYGMGSYIIFIISRKSEKAEIFVHAMRTKGNESVYSEFEQLMKENRYREAAELLQKKKGTSACFAI